LVAPPPATTLISPQQHSIARTAQLLPTQSTATFYSSPTGLSSITHRVRPCPMDPVSRETLTATNPLLSLPYRARPTNTLSLPIRPTTIPEATSSLPRLICRCPATAETLRLHPHSVM